MCTVASGAKLLPSYHGMLLSFDFVATVEDASHTLANEQPVISAAAQTTDPKKQVFCLCRLDLTRESFRTSVFPHMPVLGCWA